MINKETTLNKALPLLLQFFVVYIVSIVLGVIMSLTLSEESITIASFFASLAMFTFFGLVMWPIGAYIGYPISIVVSFVFLFYFIAIFYEFIVNCDRKGGDIPEDENGLLKRIKRSQIMFYILLIFTLFILGLLTYLSHQK